MTAGPDVVIDRITLIVSDLDRAEEDYVRTFGCRLDVSTVFDAAAEGRDVVLFGPVKVGHDQGDPVDHHVRRRGHVCIGLSLRAMRPMCNWRALTTRAKWLNA